MTTHTRMMGALIVSIVLPINVQAVELQMSGSITGTINGNGLAASMSATGDTESGEIVVQAVGIPNALGDELSWSFIHITVVCFTAAAETGGALNLFSLANGGGFSRDVLTHFSTGDTMHVLNDVAGDGTGTYTLQAVYDGTLPDVGGPVTALNAMDVIAQPSPGVLVTQTHRTYTFNSNIFTADSTVHTLYDGAPLSVPELMYSRNMVYTYDANALTATWHLHTEVTPVPEPTAMGLMGAAIGLFALTRAGRRYRIGISRFG